MKWLTYFLSESAFPYYSHIAYTNIFLNPFHYLTDTTTIVGCLQDNKVDLEE